MSSGEAVDRGQNGSQTVTNTIEDADFPVSMRGYDREAVDSYVSRVREVLAQLETSRSPEAAVKDALEKVGEQTKSVLESAGQSAEQIRVAARRDAEETSLACEERSRGDRHQSEGRVERHRDSVEGRGEGHGREGAEGSGGASPADTGRGELRCRKKPRPVSGSWRPTPKASGRTAARFWARSASLQPALKT